VRSWRVSVSGSYSLSLQTRSVRRTLRCYHCQGSRCPDFRHGSRHAPHRHRVASATVQKHCYRSQFYRPDVAAVVPNVPQHIILSSAWDGCGNRAVTNAFGRAPTQRSGRS